MLSRIYYLDQIQMVLKIHACCALLGPRQVGKTTLARMFAQQHQNFRYFDLENPIDLAKLTNNPLLSLQQDPEKLIIIDEIQLRPDLFPIIRVLADDPQNKRNFLLLGSASQDLIRQSSETLAGRIGFIEVLPFNLSDSGDLRSLWLRGGFPKSFLATSDEESFMWRQNYIKTFIERDIPALGFNIPPMQMRRFWMMLVHYHGQIFNASELGKSLGISYHTASKYLDILCGTFMVRILQPWFENLGKRQVKSPKIYFRDSGILHALINLKYTTDLESHPRYGSFWEGFALEEVIRHTACGQEECFFWATQSGAELDLVIFKGGKKVGFEFKYHDAPKTTKSMHTAVADLMLDQLIVIYPGIESYQLTEKIFVDGLQSFCSKKHF